MRGDAAFSHTREINTSKTGRWDRYDSIREWEKNATFHHTRETNTGKRGTSTDERRMEGIWQDMRPNWEDMRGKCGPPPPPIQEN